MTLSPISHHIDESQHLFRQKMNRMFLHSFVIVVYFETSLCLLFNSLCVVSYLHLNFKHNDLDYFAFQMFDFASNHCGKWEKLGLDHLSIYQKNYLNSHDKCSGYGTNPKIFINRIFTYWKISTMNRGAVTAYSASTKS